MGIRVFMKNSVWWAVSGNVTVCAGNPAQAVISLGVGLSEPQQRLAGRCQ